MGLMDFLSMVLPKHNLLRAAVTQKDPQPPEKITHEVEVQLAKLLQLEFDFLETYERMKT